MLYKIDGRSNVQESKTRNEVEDGQFGGRGSNTATLASNNGQNRTASFYIFGKHRSPSSPEAHSATYIIMVLFLPIFLKTLLNY